MNGGAPELMLVYSNILETCKTALDIESIFEPLMLNFGEARIGFNLYILLTQILLDDPIAYTKVPTKVFMTESRRPYHHHVLIPVAQVLLSTPIQFFQCVDLKTPLRIRLKRRCDKLKWESNVFLLTVGGAAVSVLMHFIRKLAKLTRVELALIVWLGSSAIADGLIALSLSLSLFKCRTGIKSTDDRITRILIFTIQTGIITIIFALADFIVFLTLPFSEEYLPLFKALSLQSTNVNFVFDYTLQTLHQLVAVYRLVEFFSSLLAGLQMAMNTRIL
ncbi:hypothetical protein CVT25_008147 [Psilocybe cyanescens]|uniref:Uncharacterized protein n=1 Tax=Psilocybe cyanescens TaxID=93625 RepID=A0A409XST6_PSICY|nr:hypothetical protein CVT25_008147 [Psilocybe cyanescens]